MDGAECASAFCLASVHKYFICLQLVCLIKRNKHRLNLISASLVAVSVGHGKAIQIEANPEQRSGYFNIVKIHLNIICRL